MWENTYSIGIIVDNVETSMLDYEYLLHNWQVYLGPT